MAYFSSYPSGAIIAAQLSEDFHQRHPNAAESFAEGDISPYVEFLRKNIHSKGNSSASVQALILDATGEPLTSEAYLRHLKTQKHKYFEPW